ncbi:MAG: hypothetical protein AAGF59_08585 [Pseudomonadota bacterium]
MRILFLHNNFPGQYRRLMRAFADDRSIDMLAGTLASNKQEVPVKRVLYEPHRALTKGIHPVAASLESAAITAQAAYKALSPVKARGWKPDVICAHSGWGPSLFLKELWPDTKLIPYFEWFYRSTGSDADFLERDNRNENDRVRTLSKNAPILFDLAAMDWGVCPTVWQRSQFPDLFRDRISVAHDGVDTDTLVPDDHARLDLNGMSFSRDDEVLTYVARNLEPYRGFPVFMEALAILQKQRPKLQTIIVGGDGVSYGGKRNDGKTHKQAALDDFELDESRIHFTGLVPFPTFRNTLQFTALFYIF